MTTPSQLLRASYPDSAEQAGPAALAPLEAKILLSHVLGWPRTALITRADETLPAELVECYRQLVARRLRGEPIAQLVGVREFYGLAFTVTPDVLIPRPETELLVELALAACAGIAQARVLDLGTGSGAIAVSIAHQRPDARVTAIDRSPAALAVARANGARLLPAERPGGAPSWLAGDWFDALGRLQDGAGLAPFHVIVSNPPYIRADDPHLRQGDLRFEPRGALVAELDGLADLRAIIARAPEFLAAQGELWLEHGYDQSAAVAALLRERGFSAVRSVPDLAGIERATGGRWCP